MKKSIRNIHYLVVHCSATPEGRDHTAKDIALWHKQRGFNEIGYNYIVRLDGTVELGRDVNKIPAHVTNHNKDSIGICYIGGIPQAEILGHRDFPGVAKACPCFNAKDEYKTISK